MPETFFLYGPEAGQEEDFYRYARIRESRKIKLNEVHYFDHPLFGALIQVSRLSKE
ncbi:MAG: peptidoglycan binding protein CsiV [Thiotrichales bacterium]|nr:peptidoglycan binding protein CsiV [Thiotrichales bacterium]